MCSRKVDVMQTNNNHLSVSVIAPVFNAEQTLGLCLEKLVKQQYPKEKCEIIVVDNNSSDNSAGIIQGFDVQYLFCEKKGPGAARNFGIRHATGEILIFIDADCLADEYLVARHVERYLFFQDGRSCSGII
jgi:glycosyltransferase involved in cell wall biosynthesis